jgi:hypothetical protein
LWSSHAQRAGITSKQERARPAGETGIAKAGEKSDAIGCWTTHLRTTPPQLMRRSRASRPSRRHPSALQAGFHVGGHPIASARITGASGWSTRVPRVWPKACRRGRSAYLRGVHVGRCDCRLQLLGRHLAPGYRRPGAIASGFVFSGLFVPATAAMSRTHSMPSGAGEPAICLNKMSLEQRCESGRGTLRVATASR